MISQIIYLFNIIYISSQTWSIKRTGGNEQDTYNQWPTSPNEWLRYHVISNKLYNDSNSTQFN